MGYWKELPTWAKGVVAVTATAATAFALYKGYKFIKKISDRSSARDTVKDAKDELKDSLKVIPASYNDSVYNGWANQIQTLLEGCDLYKNEVEIISILGKIKNDTDWLKLVSAFGVRTMEECGWGSYEADLPTVLKKELTNNTVNSFNSSAQKLKLKARI